MSCVFFLVSFQLEMYMLLCIQVLKFRTVLQLVSLIFLEVPISRLFQDDTAPGRRGPGMKVFSAILRKTSATALSLESKTCPRGKYRIRRVKIRKHLESCNFQKYVFIRL